MTSRNRLLAAASGADLDRKPVIDWPYWSEESDLRHFNHETLPDEIEEDTDKLALVEITNPFGIAMQRGIDINQALRDDPKAGNRLLGDLCDTCRRDIETAFEAGADGILYRLYGARARHCTPMQYGGYYLERDRELMELAGGSVFNMIFVVGEEDVYLDFVSDLPAHAFGWDYKTSKIPTESVREMRSGSLFSEDENSDILLHPGTAFLSRVLESSLRTEDSYAI